MIKDATFSSVLGAWQSVYLARDPFSWPYREGLVGCLCYPTYGYHLTELQYQALLNAIKRIDEDGFFISIVESREPESLAEDSNHWSCELPPYADYADLPIVLENAIYSKLGTWGVIISHELHALVGGSEVFVDALRESYGQCDEDVIRLNEEWSGNPNSAWLGSIMGRVAK